MTIHLFNPQHDLAMADGHAGYSAPESARQFAADCAPLPLWYARPGDAVDAPGCDPDWWEKQCALFPDLKEIHIVGRIGRDDRVEPWGWDAAVAHATGHGDPESIERIRRYAHRRHTTTAMQQLQERLDFPLPAPAKELTDMEQVLAFAERQEKWVLKAPLSGSGRGIRMGQGRPDTAQTAWIQRTLRRQESLMGEAQLDKVQDFAMEFLLTENECRWAGWSVFDTHGGGVVYAGNQLAPEAVLEARLGKQIALEQLQAVRRELPGILLRLFPHYQGVIGVDMLLYHRQDTLRLHPMVEMNLRHTMGWVAHELSRSRLAEGSCGRFVVGRTDAAMRRQLAESDAQVTVTGGRVVCGRLALTPIGPDTLYAAWMDVIQQQEF